MDCKKALTEADGDFEKAIEILRKKGQKVSASRSDKEAKEGSVFIKVSNDMKEAVLIALNCETDFVARNEIFTDLVKDVSMHITASNPLYVSSDDVTKEDKIKMSGEFTEKVKAEGKPENMVPQIVDGMLKKYFAERCLLDQPFVKNPDQTVDQYVKEGIAKLGENIVIRRFYRIALGEVA